MSRRGADGRETPRRYDLVVLGGGTAGLVTALGAAGVGARVALVERARTGGDCLWTGCVPSKSLIAAANLVQRMRKADSVGVTPVEPQIDFARVMGHVHDARARIAPQDSPERLRRDGVEVIDEEGRFVAPGLIAAGSRRLRFRTAVVATGSVPAIPPVAGLAQLEPLTNEDLWDLKDLPRRLLVLGGGSIGCELGQAFARLGSRVTLVEMQPALLPGEEPEAGALLAARLRAEGVDVRVGARAVRAEPRGDGGTLTIEGSGGAEAVEFDRVLVATGRQAQTAGLGLEAVCVEVDRDGSVLVDRHLRTTARGVFAAGDVTGALPFTHVAAYHARVVVANALFHARRSVDYRAVPWATFTDPEVGRVGMSEAEARKRLDGRVVVQRFDYGELDRAVAAGEAYGFAKLVGDRKGRLVGATVAAPAGGEAIAELASWVARGGTIADISETVHAYPTLAEGPARAADDYLRARYFNDRVRAIVRPALALLRLIERPS